MLRWERDDGVGPMEFRTDKIRQIILRGADSQTIDASTSHIELVNGDRIPATITGLDADNLTIDSAVAGSLVIPRDAVRRVSPNPFGGRLVYAGPFRADEWRFDDGSEPKPDEEEAAEARDAEEPDNAEEAEEVEEATGEDEEESAPWRHLGSRWYHVKSEDALLLDAGMPARSIFRFHLDWRGRSPVSIGFHADFAPRPPGEKKEEHDEQQRVRRIVSSSSGLTDYFGSSLVMTLRGNYVNLYQCGYNKDGEPFVDSLRASNRSLQIEDSGEADFELRTDLEDGFISLFVNGEFSMQWQIDPVDPDDEDAWQPGTGLGFRIDTPDSPLRISDIVVAEWNGMPDAARSLESEDRDVVLLTNGTDRVSGRVVSITDGRLTLEGKYAPLVIPIEEIADIRFATDSLREQEAASGDRVRVHFQPVGLVSGVPGVTRDGSMTMKSTLLGDLTLSLDSAVILEFREGGSFLDAWDDDF